MEEQPVAVLTGEERSWAAICHLGAYFGFILPYIGHILGPLVLWLIKRNDSAFVDDQGKQTLNFQISMTVYSFLVVFVFGIFALTLAAGMPRSQGAPIPAILFAVLGGGLLILLFVLDIILVLVAAINASNGHLYRYPLAIQFIR